MSKNKKETFVEINKEVGFSGNDTKQILLRMNAQCSAKRKATQILQNKTNIED